MITIDKETTYVIGLSEDAVTELRNYLKVTLEQTTDPLSTSFMSYEEARIAITLYDELNKL